ncbi:TetR family transcriptional regulator C-terminal domain-containing protein [Sphingomonas profundi]|uniref:TetR family transcriptional regulator C-terminal domain-containing protein n=1 Tax=Alterirhizorhabdus profundi TaxID=2681549 RepID=UPI0012E8695C|nr:TetR family transcriptional regulator C-terminal domain-containing protein [Sphingomonas profundi]
MTRILARPARQAPELRRRDLLEVTMRCLAELGPRGATGREICRRAGVSHGLLRHYFVNPENLLLETYQQLCDHFIARFEAALAEPALDPWAAFDRFFAVLFFDDWASKDILGAWIAFWTLVRGNADFAGVSESYNDRLRALLTSALRRLPGDRPMPDRQAVPILSAVMDGIWLDFCLAPDRLPPEQALALCNAALRRIAA